MKVSTKKDQTVKFEDDLVDEMMSYVDHEKLLQCVGVELPKIEPPLKKQKRSATSKNVSLFSQSQVDESGSNTKVNLQQLLKNVPQSGDTNDLKRKLSQVEETTKQLSAPLTKPISEKIQRKTEYKKVSDDVGKWDSIVQRHRRASHLQFPLNQEPFHIKTVDEFFKRKRKALTPLEKEMHALLSNNKCVERPDQELTKMEEETIAALSLEEASARVNELRKNRALISQQQARANRQKKIKSRNYHRMVKKQLMKGDSKLPPVEEDPEEADRQRAEERASQRHQKGSKWARRSVLVAKKNVKLKFDLEEQRRKHVGLLEKTVHSDTDSDDGEQEEKLPEVDFFKGVQPPEPSFQLHQSFAKDNPWLRHDSSVNVLASDCKENVSKSDVINNKKGADSASIETSIDNKMNFQKETLAEERMKLKKWLNSQESSTKTHTDVVKEAKTKFKNAVSVLSNLNHENTEAKSEKNDLENYDVVAADDEGLIENLEQLNDDENDDVPVKSNVMKMKTKQKMNKDNVPLKGNIDFNFVSSSKPLSRLRSHIVEDVGEGQKMTIEEAFANDNVISEFRKEKKNFTNKTSETDNINTRLPGWGRWAGSGIRKMPKKTKKKQTTRKRGTGKRKGTKLGHVILNDKRDVYIAKHQVHSLPFPFVNNEQFESTIARPVGSTWNTPEIFSAAIKPKVSTKLGTIISPMNSNEAFTEKTKADNIKQVKSNYLKKKRNLAKFGDIKTF